MSDALVTCTLEELAKTAGLSPRTVRYYVQRGLLPPPVFRGPHTGYDGRYLRWLRYIQIRQGQGWSLDEIAAALVDRDPPHGQGIGHRALDDADLEQAARASEHDQADATANQERASAAPNPTVNKTPQARAQAPAEVWMRMPIAEGIEMWLRHEADAQQRLLQDVVLHAAQTAAAAARTETR